MQVKRFVRDFVTGFIDDNVLNAGAMMAYYAVLALFPMLVFIVAVAMLVIPSSIVQQGVQVATEAVPPAIRDPLVGRMTSFVHSSHGTFAFVGAVLAVWGARGGLTSLMQVLNAVFHKQETRSWLRRQATALLLALSVSLLVVVALALLVVGPMVGHWVANRLGFGATFDLVWGIARWIGAGLLVMVVWAVFYKFLPDTDARFRVFTPGTVIGVVLWLIASYGFGVYLGHFNNYETTYGTLGGAIIFLTWLWMSNLALFVGAEVDHVLSELGGREKHTTEHPADIHHCVPNSGHVVGSPQHSL